MSDFVKISYTGKLKESSKIFDTTLAEVAKKERVFDKKKSYQPLPVVIGKGQVIEGLEEALKSMKLKTGGEKKNIEIPPEKAFGVRDPSKVRIVSRGRFKKEGINPVPGMPVELDGKPARIQTVSGGRVRVDFNSDLAGKTVVYDIKIEGVAKTEKDKVNYLIERNFDKSDDFGVNLSKSKINISLPKRSFHDRNLLIRKASLAGELFQHLGMNEVTFEETWKKPEEKEAEKEKTKKKGKSKK